MRAFDVDGIEDERQLDNAIRFRAQEAVAIPIDQAVLDYHIVGETVDEDGNVSRRILLAAAYRESIDRYVKACRAAKIELVGIDLEAFALLRAVLPVEHAETDKRAALVAVSLGHDRSTLAISDGAICEFTRVLEWGGEKLESAIGLDLGVTPDEAHELLLDASLERDADSEADPRQRRRARSIRRELQKLARELVASLQFYQTQSGSLAISQILVSGGASRLPGLPEELERLTRERSAAPIRSLTCRQPTRCGRVTILASLAIAIGLGVEA